MKLSVRKFMNLMETLEGFLDDNFKAKGETFTEKALSVTNEMPKGVVEKMKFLADLYDRAKNGETPSAADLKQAGYWINAVYPYLSNGAQLKLGAGALTRVIAIAALAAAAFVAYKLLAN